MAGRRTHSARRPSPRSQYFLRTAGLAAELVRDAEIGSGDLVLDIGAGRGRLTEQLARVAARVIAIEVDPVLARALRGRWEKVHVVTCDATTVDLPDEPSRVVANIPFHRTTDLMHLLLDDPDRPLARADLIVEWDVAVKRAVPWPSSLNGVVWSAFWETSLSRRLPRSAFAPMPAVDAGVLTLRRRSIPLVERKAALEYRRFVAAGFRTSGPHYSTSGSEPVIRPCALPLGPARAVRNELVFLSSILVRVNPTFQLGRIAGIRIGVNWSWLIVFALIVWSLAAAVFPSQNPGFSDGEYVAMAVAAALLFFASLLLHELGHALQARRDGVEIEGINLWLFGGVAQFKGGFPSAGAEFRIAIAGPLVSLALGALFVLIAAFAGLPNAVDGVVAWLGFTNLILLAFNLLPALPLDGGRVLRSALWYFRGDLQWATWVAAGVGRGFGFLFIGLGIFMLIVEGAFSGAWLAFVGWFLLQAATGEARYVATKQALDGLKVRDLMIRQPVTVEASLSLGQFMDDVAWAQRHTTYPAQAR